MATYKTNDFRKGLRVEINGEPYMMIEMNFVKPGKGPAYVQVKMKNLDTGTIKINRFNSSDKVEDVNIDKRTMQFLYDSSGQGKGPWVFMDNETYDQVELA